MPKKRGQPKKPRHCAVCGVRCESGVAAREHCKKAKKMSKDQETSLMRQIMQ